MEHAFIVKVESMAVNQTLVQGIIVEALHNAGLPYMSVKAIAAQDTMEGVAAQTTNTASLKLPTLLKVKQNIVREIHLVAYPELSSIIEYVYNYISRQLQA